MADVFGLLGQAKPAATTLTDVYTVPTGKVATVDIYVANTSGTPATFRVALAKSGAADSLEQYISYNEDLGANVRKKIARVVLNAGDVVRFYGSGADAAINVIGIEEDAA